MGDLKERGMLDRTLVIWMGEFGRTPKINQRAAATTVRGLQRRAGRRRRQGRPGDRRSAADGTDVKERPVTVPDLFCSVYKRSRSIRASNRSARLAGP